MNTVTRTRAMLAFAVLALNAPAHGAPEHIDPALLRVSPHPSGEDTTQRRPTPALRSAISASGFGLNEAVRLAVEWHPSIAQAVSVLYQQGEGINTAEAGYYPQLSGGIKGGLDSGYDGERGSQSLSLSLKQMLYDFGKVDSAVNAARAKAAQAQAQLLLTIDQVARDTAYAYIESQRYRELQATAEAQLQGLQKIVELARQRSDMGASTRSDVVQAESRVDGGRATLQEYRAAYARWQATLANLLGRATTPDGDDTQPPGLAQACEAADPNNGTDALPAVLAAFAQRDQAQAELAQARAQAYPTVSLEPSINHYLDNNYNKDNPYLDRTQAGIYINVEVPIYQGGATSARTRAAGYALGAADAAEDAARLQARQGLAEARVQTLSLSNRLEALRRRQGNITEARELYGRQYLELGTRPLLDLLNAEQEIHQARFDLTNTQEDLQRLQVDCLYNSGGMRRVFALEGRNLQGVEVLP
nr:TolC family outer membrane protein [Pseudomonas japonica]